MYISKMAQFFSLISCQIQHVFSFPNLIEINLCLFPKWLKIFFFLYFSCQIQHVTIVQSTLSWVFFSKKSNFKTSFFTFSENQIFRFPSLFPVLMNATACHIFLFSVCFKCQMIFAKEFAIQMLLFCFNVRLFAFHNQLC